jgi:RHS repeat-associated protein
VSEGTHDMGQDGYISGANEKVARDIFGYGLHYFDDGDNETDYKAIDPSSATGAFARPNNGSFVPLFNGNIGGMSVNNKGLTGAGVNSDALFYNYRYDQLNRIRSMDAFNGLNSTDNEWEPVSIDDYREAVSYDPNGNILSYKRNGAPSVSSQPEQMDRLGYIYYANTNQLRQVTDTVSSGNYTTDIDTQTDPDNYTYDAIGNLITDEAEGIDAITWTLYGKISSIIKGADTIRYSYDAAGNRISKTVSNITTVYVRDGSGNVMSVYEQPAAEENAVNQIENHIYGSSRLGMTRDLTEAPTDDIELDGDYGMAMLSTFTRGEKVYELGNHLGNVLVTVNDKKLAVDGNTDGDIDYYIADAVSATDYYPFGLDMPSRKLGSGRYGFNGKEKDNDIHSLTAYDYGFRIYNPAIGKFLSVDPLTVSYPELTPYQYASNKPIEAIDLDGLEAFSSKKAYMRIQLGYESSLKKLKDIKVYASAASPNVPEWIANNILNASRVNKAQAKKSCNCEVLMSEKETEVANILLISTDISESKIMREDEQEALVERNRNLAGNPSVYPQAEGSYRARPLVKAQIAMSNIEAETHKSIGVRNEAKLEKVNSAIVAATFIAKIIAFGIKNDQIATFNAQKSAAGHVVSFIQDVLDNKVLGAQIPSNLQNRSDLSAIANYLFIGEISYVNSVNGEGKTVLKENISLMNTARDLLKIMEKQVREGVNNSVNSMNNPVDNTSNNSIKKY